MVNRYLIRLIGTIYFLGIINDITAQVPEIIVNSGHTEVVRSLDISSDDKYIVSGSEDNTVKLWERQSGRLIRTLYHGVGDVYKVFFIEGDSLIVSCGGNDTVRIWETQTGKLARHFGYKVNEYNNIAVSKDKKIIIASDMEDTVRLYDIATGKVEKTLSFPHVIDSSYIFLEDDKNSQGDDPYPFSSEFDELVEEHSSDDQYMKMPMPYFPEIKYLGLSNNKKYVYAATPSKVYVWNLVSGELVNTFSDIGYIYDWMQAIIISVSFSSDQEKLIVVTNDLSYKWDIVSGEKSQQPLPMMFDDYYTGSVIDIENNLLYVTQDKLFVIDIGTGKMVRQLNESITSIAFPQNNKYLVTGNEDNVIKLWNWEGKDRVISGYFEDHRIATGAIKGSPDGKHIAVVEGSVVSIEQTNSGEVVHKLSDHKAEITSLVFVNEDILVTSAKDSLLLFWDIKKGEIINQTKLTDAYPTIINYNKNNNTIVCGDTKGMIYILSITGKSLYDKKLHNFSISDISISHNGKYWVSADINGTIRLLNTKENELIHTFSYLPSIHTLDFSHSDHYLLAASDTNYSIWDLSNNELKKTVSDSLDTIYCIAFGPVDDQIVISKMSGMHLTNFISNKNINKNYLVPGGVVAFDYVPGDKYVYCANLEGSIYQWDISSSVYVGIIGEKPGISTNAMCLSADNSCLVVGDRLGHIRSWNIKKNENIKFYETLVGTEYNIAMSPDNKYILSGDYLYSTYLIDTEEDEINEIITGDAISSFMGNKMICKISSNSEYFFKDLTVYDIKTTNTFYKFDIYVNAGASTVSDNDEYIAMYAYEIEYKEEDEYITLPGEKIYVFDVVTEKPVKIFEDTLYPNILRFSPNNKYLISASTWGDPLSINVWNMETGKLQYNFQGHQNRIYALSFTPDNKYLVSGSFDNTIKIWDLETGNEIKTLTLHTDYVTSLDISKDGKFLVSGSIDRTLRVWKLPEGIPMATITIMNINDWIVTTPDGLFDATPAAMKALYYVEGMEIIELGQMKDRFYEPGLLQKLLGFNEEGLRDVSNLQKIDLYPKIKLGEVNKEGDFFIELTDQGGGIGKVKVFINGKEIADDVRGSSQDSKDEKMLIMQNIKNHPYLLPDRDNIIEVKAHNAEGYLVSKGVKIIYNPQTKSQAAIPNLYIISIGISDYTGDRIDLKYAANDAQDMAKSLEIGARRLFGAEKTFTKLLTTYKPSESNQNPPTKAEIIKSFEMVAQKAKSTDILVVYFSGHGINWGGDNGDFYYLTQEAYSADQVAYNDPAIRNNATLSSAELVELIKKIPALKQVLIIDACASGRVVENLMAQRHIPSSTLRALDRMKDRTGMHIITGCTADAVSYEASSFGQGILTYSLIEGMKGKALRDERYVDVNLLFQNARDRVPQLAQGIGGIQSPEVFSPYGAESFDIGELTVDDRQEIPLAKVKPVFIRSNFQDEEEMEDILNLSKIMDEKLNDISQGVKSNVVFVDAREFPGAYKLIGRYTRKNNEITLSMKIRIGEETITHEVNGKNLDELITNIIDIIEIEK